MRILTVSNYYPPHYKGAYEILCEATVNELVRRGHVVHVLTGNWGVKGEKARRRPGEENVYRVLHLHSFRGLDRPKRMSKQLVKACTSRLDYRMTRRIGAAVQPDLVYAWNMGDLSMSVLGALQQLGVRTVFDLHDYWLLERYRDLIRDSNRVKRAYRSAIEGCTGFERMERRHLIAISEALKQEYVRTGFPEENLTVIRRGIPAHYIQDRSQWRDNSRSELRLLFAGRLVEEKGVQVAVQALAHLARENPEEQIHLDVAGSGEYDSHLRALVASLGLADLVRFLGMIEHAQLAGLYQEYDAVLVPSIWVDPLPRAVIEPMARGVCVIASDLGGAREVIVNDANGLLVRPNEPEALAQAVMKLARTPGRAEELGLAALATIRGRFVFEDSVELVEEYLSSVVRDGGSAFSSPILSRCP